MSWKITNGGIYPVPAQQQPYRYGRREGGRYTVIPYESTSQIEIDNLAFQADQDGLNYEVSLTHGKARVEIEYNWNCRVGSYAGTTTEAEETWEITPGKAMKDILDSNNPLVLSCSSGELADMKARKIAGTLQSFKKDASGLIDRQQWGTGPTNYTDAGMQIYQMLLDGVEQVEVPTPVLSHSKVVTANYVYPAQFTNVGKIISSATLISSEGVPSTVLFDFPTDTDPSPAQFPIGALGIYQSFLYGWLKNAPSVRQVSKRKWNITQTWDYGLWLMNLYGGTRL